METVYNVVFKTLVGPSIDAVTWTSFRDKAHFDKWYTERLKSWYAIVEAGVTEERALELCSTPEAKAAFKGHIEELLDLLQSL